MVEVPVDVTGCCFSVFPPLHTFSNPSSGVQFFRSWFKCRTQARMERARAVRHETLHRTCAAVSVKNKSSNLPDHPPWCATCVVACTLWEATAFCHRHFPQRPIHKKDTTRDCCRAPHLHHILCSAHTNTCATARSVPVIPSCRFSRQSVRARCFQCARISRFLSRAKYNPKHTWMMENVLLAKYQPDARYRCSSNHHFYK